MKRSDSIPAPDDLSGWKDADARLHRRYGSTFAKEVLPVPQAALQYFNDSDVEYFIEEHEQRSVLPAFAAWSILHFRPEPGKATHGEQLLKRDLPEAQKMLLRARMESWPSLYRIVRHAPEAGTLELEDVLLGGTAVVHDKAMAQCATDGLFLAARVFAAGQFRFIDMVGPPLGSGMGTEGVQFLKEQGLEFTAEGLRQGAHLFGWLWAWCDEWESNMQSMQLRNMDGDELLWHTASFAVEHMEALRQALAAREDIEKEGEEFRWVQKTGDAAKTMGGSVSLGNLELIDNELVVSVNSAERLATARQWLEQIPGVVFRDVTTREWNDPNVPPDEGASEREPVEMTPELRSKVQEMMDQHYMKWLDAPLPVLQGKTPRQTCETADGRQEVAQLIRTIPDPMGPASITVPRQAMLADLGLDEGMEGSTPAVEPRAAGYSMANHVRMVVGRNDRCPCGSGKKYKKCCGR